MKNKPDSGNVDESEFLMRLLFDAYYWFDESLQRSMQAQNIPPLSRSQSMVMICLVEGITRPSALARKLRVSRQAMQKTLADLEAKGYLRLEPDPEDRRAKHVRLSKIGIQRQNSARVYLRNLEQELRTRLGARTVTALSDALQADWGDPSAIETD
jgi:DNA-binding MarR family transcriptional regulator